MSLVVTGAAGFIGRQVTAVLVARGHHVVGVDRRDEQPLAGETRLVAELSQADDDVTTALREADAVIHLAGCPGVRDTAPDLAARRRRDNVVAGARVLAATPATTTVVVASSSSVYGGALPGQPSHEDDRLRPRGGYARSKLALERRCARRAAEGGHVAVARPFTVAGEGQRPDMAIARWLAAAERDDPVTVLGSSDRLRDVTDVRDVAEGLVRMVEREVTATVNLGTGQPRRLADLLDAVAVATGTQPRVELVPAAAVEVPATCADTERCRRLLGFVPRTDLVDLVRRQRSAASSGPRRPLALEGV